MLIISRCQRAQIQKTAVFAQEAVWKMESYTNEEVSEQRVPKKQSRRPCHCCRRCPPTQSVTACKMISIYLRGRLWRSHCWQEELGTFRNQCKSWTTQDWEKIMFSDEATFLQFRSCKYFVWRPPGSSPLQPSSVMVWGCFSSDGPSGLVFLPKEDTMTSLKCREHQHLLQFMEIRGCHVFQQDNTLCHKLGWYQGWTGLAIHQA